jgi:hypothetical protein
LQLLDLLCVAGLQMRVRVFQIISALFGNNQAEDQPLQQQQQQAAVLQQPATAPLAGILISSCLAAAEQEVAAAGKGSKALRHAALQALQAVVGAVEKGPQLAFFLPGLASGLAKQLLAAGRFHKCSGALEIISFSCGVEPCIAGLTSGLAKQLLAAGGGVNNSCSGRSFFAVVGPLLCTVLTLQLWRQSASGPLLFV